jgi:hypothetical protein
MKREDGLEMTSVVRDSRISQSVDETPDKMERQISSITGLRFELVYGLLDREPPGPPCDKSTNP